ncbi:hypothetical protein J2Y58_002220 [Sphingomonas sp. BE138]|uniref:hypothetical protein n=1 Tax=Sphingomonas sp. BE138 TaxID=2817845 RepID=UPI00286360F6|nr:hypothetical protein [Sphingomonas sp. BE138]MDR6788855.1 hypothetical protein [Sphingomonas sp. BE138]
MLGAWALAALVLVVGGWDAIVARRFADADDAMRLLQVRDWLAGQGWFDVAQHRLNGGDFPMHWSRLVDLPLAATMLLLRPLLGGSLAEHAALVVVPLLTLLATLALVASIARRVGGEALVVPALSMAALAMPLTFQMSPLRIDHHGWQVVFALAAVRALLAAPTTRSGAAAGMALATLLTISLEGLPVTVAITGVAAFAWVAHPGRGAQLRALVAMLAAGALLLHAATRGPGFWQPACDAMAPGWLAALGLAALGVVTGRAVEHRGVIARIVALATTAVAVGATLLWSSPTCLAGPFGTLPPLVYRIWYLSVLEGRPVWAQESVWAFTTLALPLAGLAGAAIGWRGAAGEARTRWTILLALIAAGTVTAALVVRAGATANALAAPGAAVWLAALLARARGIMRPLPRVAATVAVLALAAPGTLAGLAVLAVRPATPVKAPPEAFASCATALDMRPLAALPPATVFAPIDMTPELLVDTPHRAIAGGYHRGASAIAKVITGFAAAPGAARRTIVASGADYLAACPGMPELALYRRIAPAGLWARLARGERFAWLHPVALPGPARAWRVIRPLPEGRSAP